MIEERLIELIDPMLRSAGSSLENGEEYREPPLDVLRYYCRPVRWHPIPLLGRAVSVVAVVRQPVDLAFSEFGYNQLLSRVAIAASSRFPPWKGLAIGLTALIVTPEPIGPGDDAVIARVLDRPRRKHRVVPFGVLRLNLGQEAMSYALKASPGKLFPEPMQLADVLSEHLRRFVSLIEP